MYKKSPDRRPVRMEAECVSGIIGRERGNSRRVDLHDRIWQRDHEKRNRTAVSHFFKTDPTFSRCFFSGYPDHGMVCGYILRKKENRRYFERPYRMYVTKTSLSEKKSTVLVWGITV